MTESVPTDSQSVPRRGYGWPSIVIAILAAVVYAYVFWEALQNLIELPAVRGAATPWWLLILDVALPVVVYVVAIILGLRQRVLVRGAFFLVGATVLACATVGSLAFNLTH